VGVKCSIDHNPTLKIPTNANPKSAVVVALDQVPDREPDKREVVSVMIDLFELDADVGWKSAL
jgi:hypothetical protein